MKENETQTTIDKEKADDIQPPEGNWESVDDATFVKFEKIGDSVEGMLIDKDTSETYGHGMYTVIQPKIGRKRFHGTKHLDDIMQSVNIQDYIKITYVDTQNLPNGTLKIFTVDRKK